MSLDRRHVLAAALGAVCLRDAVAALAELPRTPRLPAVFLGHGSPMNAIEDNNWRRGWQDLGRRFGREWPKPAAIVCVSAHWVTRGWWVTAMDAPRTIHDFGGFPQALFDQSYPAPGSPAVAAQLLRALPNRALQLDDLEWGLDHGTWSVLMPMFPAADIPVLQLSLDVSRPPQEHLALGRELRHLRERGVLLIGSGNVVHNLGATRRGASMMSAHDWAIDFDRWVAERLEKGDAAGLGDILRQGALARQAHPTLEHYLPLLHVMGATAPGERAAMFNVGYQSASISMRSVVWG